MMNPFLLNYHERLQAWYKLRENLQNQSLDTICLEVDAFWQQCPIVNSYLHPNDVKNWPDPWQLLSDNMYCEYAKALGMSYTLLLLGTEGVDMIEATDYDDNSVVLVSANYAKYILNYWPGTVVNNTLDQFIIKKYINLNIIKNKMREV